MKIKSNKTFECYETAYESWVNNGKDITLDGVKLIPITTLDKIRTDIEKECATCEYEDDFVYNSGLLKAIEIIDKYKKGGKV